MGTGRGIRTGVGQGGGASPVSYKHSFLVKFLQSCGQNGLINGRAFSNAII